MLVIHIHSDSDSTYVETVPYTSIISAKYEKTKFIINLVDYRQIPVTRIVYDNLIQYWKDLDVEVL